MRIGDTVRLRDEAIRGARGELAGEVGKVGELIPLDDGTLCTVVFEHLRCVVWDAPVSDFEPVERPAPALH